MKRASLQVVVLFLLNCVTTVRAGDAMPCAGFVEISDSASKSLQSARQSNIHALVIFANFSYDSSERRTAPTWAHDLFIADLPGSFTHFYQTMSRGKLTVTGEVAVWRYQSTQMASAYLSEVDMEPGDFGRFSREIIQAADEDIDFSLFDNDGPDGLANSGDDDGLVDLLFIVVDQVPSHFLVGNASGIGVLGFEEAYQTNDLGHQGQPIRVDGNRGTLQQGRTYTETVGVMAHEFGHQLGLPDLFNKGFLQLDGAGPEEDSAGIGAWGLMGWGALGWNGNDGPNSFSAWSRAQLGWIDVEEVRQERQSVQIGEVNETGQIIKVAIRRDEYFLIEHRRRDGSFYDRHMPGEGLLVWHVFTGPLNPERGSIARIDLETADGRWQEAGFPLGTIADPLGGGDNLDFWAHDSAYAEAHGGNLGDATDPFDGMVFHAFTPESNPGSTSNVDDAGVRLENMRFIDGVFHVDVEMAPLRLEVEHLEIVDDDKDGIVVAGEEVRMNFRLINKGGFTAEDVRVRLHSNDPEVEVIAAEAGYGDIGLGNTATTVRSGEALALRLKNEFTGIHRTKALLELWANGRLIGEHIVEITGVSSRQPIRLLRVEEVAGDQDGVVQRGEFIRLHLELEGGQVELLQPLRFSLRALDDRVVRVGSGMVEFGYENGRIISLTSPEFLIPVHVESALVFELQIETGFHRGRDSLFVSVEAGTDRVPPRILDVGSRRIAHGIKIIVPKSQLLDGSPIKEGRAEVYNLGEDTPLISISLEERETWWEGTWKNSRPGDFQMRVIFLDEANNKGVSDKYPLSVDEPPINNGATGAWQAQPFPASQIKTTVNQLFVAPSDPDMLYASARSSIWRSTDGGDSWKKINVMRGRTLYIDAGDPMRLHAVGNFPYSSDDGGETWRTVAGDFPNLRGADPNTPRKLYGWGERRSLVISEDGGESWTDTGLEDVLSVEGNPVYAQILYALQFQQITDQSVLWHSENGGRSWQQQAVLHFDTVKADPNSLTGLYRTARDTLFYSNDAGSSWGVRKVFNGLNFIRLWVHPKSGAVYVLNSDGRWVWISEDGGYQWEQNVSPFPIGRLILDPTDDQVYYAIIYIQDGLSDTGRNTQWKFKAGAWSLLELPLEPLPAGSVAFDTEGNLLSGSLVTFGPGSFVHLYVSNNGGADWSQRTQGVSRSIQRHFGDDTISSILLDPHNPDIMIAHTSGQFIRSIDQGASWRPLLDLRGFTRGLIPPMVRNPAKDGIYYIASNGLYRSQDWGESWEERSRDTFRFILDLAVESTDGEAIYVASLDSIWRSADEGLTWDFFHSFAPEEWVRGLAFDTGDPPKLYAVTKDGFYVNENRTAPWQLRSRFSKAAFILGNVRLRVDPQDPDHILLAINGQVQESYDRGRTWEILTEDWRVLPVVNDVAMDPLNPGSVYAATPWGVYRLDRSMPTDTAIEATDTRLPTGFALEQNFPNPFNLTTTIAYHLPYATAVKLTLYDILGQQVRELVDRAQATGRHQVVWDGHDGRGNLLASGVYFYRLEAGDFSRSRRLVLLK